MNDDWWLMIDDWWWCCGHCCGLLLYIWILTVFTRLAYSVNMLIVECFYLVFCTAGWNQKIHIDLDDDDDNDDDDEWWMMMNDDDG